MCRTLTARPRAGSVSSTELLVWTFLYHSQ